MLARHRPRINQRTMLTIGVGRKHSLTLQLHTANIVAAHNTLEQKDKAIQDIKEQKNRFVLPFSQVVVFSSLLEVDRLPVIMFRLSLVLMRRRRLLISPYRLDSERARLLNALAEARNSSTCHAPLN